MPIFGRSKEPAAPPDPLDHPLVQFSQHKEDVWTVRNAIEGTAIFGGIGSGKTSGSGETIAKAFLNNGFGGLVLAANIDDRNLWINYCHETKREKQLIIFSPESDFTFDFLNYSYMSDTGGSGLTENLVSLFTTVVEVMQRGGGQGGGDNNPYFRNAMRQLLRNAIDLEITTRHRVNLAEIYQIVTSAPHSPEELASEQWRETSLCYQLINELDTDNLTPIEAHNMEVTAAYWLDEFAHLAEETRSGVIGNFTGLADAFLRGKMYEMFCTSKNNIVPEYCLEGGIILIDLPLSHYQELGRYAQVLWKYIWQRAITRRNMAENDRPVFLWMDEAQEFLTGYDSIFQTQARHYNAAPVYITQNIPNYRQALGTWNSQAVESLLGNLRTKIFHSNDEHITNELAADTIAKAWQAKIRSGSGKEGPHTSYEEMLEYLVTPGEFITLMTGGPHNDFMVEGIVFQGGRDFKANGGRTYIRTGFKQTRRSRP